MRFSNSVDRLPNDEHAGDADDNRLEETGQRFGFTVAVSVIFVSGAGCRAHGDEVQRRRKEVEHGIEQRSPNAKGACQPARRGFECDQEDGDEDGKDAPQSVSSPFPDLRLIECLAGQP